MNRPVTAKFYITYVRVSSNSFGVVLMDHAPKVAFLILIFYFSFVGGIKTGVLGKQRLEELQLPINSRSFLLGVTPTFKLNETLEEVYNTAGSVAG